MPIYNPPGLNATDDGTYINVVSGSTSLFRVKKSNGQMQISGGYDSDVSL